MAIPGLSRLDHVGFTVPDLEAAHSWLVDVLGCEYMYRLGPFASDDSDWMREHMNVHPRTVMRELRFYRCGGQAVFEVFQYEAPEQGTEVPRNSDVGGHHVALYVDDLSTLPQSRGRGHAGGLLDRLVEEAARLGCAELHLDSGVGAARWTAHRLYMNHGLTIVSHHFARPV